MAKRDSHQKVKEENRNMLLALKKPICHLDHCYFPLPFRPQTNTFLNIGLDFSGWKTHSFRGIMLFSLPNIQIPNMNVANTVQLGTLTIHLSLHLKLNVHFYRLHDCYYRSKYISIINTRTGKSVQDTHNGQIGLERLRRQKNANHTELVHFLRGLPNYIRTGKGLES